MDAQTKHNAPADVAAGIMAVEERIFDAIEEIRKLQSINTRTMLTTADVALLTGFSKVYVSKLVTLRAIPHYKPNGKTIFFDKNEVLEWMKRKRIEAVENESADAILERYINS